MQTAIAGLLVALIIAIAGYGCGHRAGTEAAETKASLDMATHIGEDQAAAAAAAAMATAASGDIAKQVNTAAEAAYKKGMEDAEAKRSTVIADLRSGNLELRKQWQGCQVAAAPVPGTPGAAPESGREAADREEGAGDLVRAAAQCDAQVQGLIEAYTSAKDRIDAFNKQSGSSSRR